jgi:hypothetical protein
VVPGDGKDGVPPLRVPEEQKALVVVEGQFVVVDE